MKRREFIRKTSVLGLGSIALNGIQAKGNSLPPAFNCAGIGDRIFVMVNMFGANDTLNTVVPVSQYGLYASARPKIRISDSGPNKYLVLDSSLPEAQATALHPAMTSFKELYNQGKLNIVHGVGYPDNNRSHFKSDDLWNTAGDSTPEKFNYTSGWAGDLFEARYPGLISDSNAGLLDPPCIELGATGSSLLFQTASDNNVSVLLSNNNVTKYYTTMIGIGGPPPEHFPTGNYGIELSYIFEIQRLSNKYAERIETLFNSGQNSTIEYPNTAIASQLKTVARLMAGGAKTNMYTVHHFGYDTHTVQVVSNESHTGRHASLLTDLTEAIKAFMDDISLLGMADRVVITTHSEFGRAINENSGLGTDHGGVSTMFVIGNAVKPGVTGRAIDLTKVRSGALTDLQYDYRTVWSAVLQDFMGHDTQLMASARMDSFLTDKAPVISDDFKVNGECYIVAPVDDILPVSIADLAARLLPDGKAEVSWQTSFEINNEEFVVEHSVDVNSWKRIGRISGYGNSSVARHYTIEHDDPVPGINYYRLWQIDYDGKREVFGPVILKVNSKMELAIKVYPNPAIADCKVDIVSDRERLIALHIFDIQGHALYNRQLQVAKGSNQFKIPIGSFRGYRGEIIVQFRNEYQVLQVDRIIIQ